jgi:hypothetical protein
MALRLLKYAVVSRGSEIPHYIFWNGYSGKFMPGFFQFRKERRSLPNVQNGTCSSGAV